MDHAVSHQLHMEVRVSFAVYKMEVGKAFYQVFRCSAVMISSVLHTHSANPTLLPTIRPLVAAFPRDNSSIELKYKVKGKKCKAIPVQVLRFPGG